MVGRRVTLASRSCVGATGLRPVIEMRPSTVSGLAWRPPNRVVLPPARIAFLHCAILH